MAFLKDRDRKSKHYPIERSMTSTTRSNVLEVRRSTTAARPNLTAAYRMVSGTP